MDIRLVQRDDYAQLAPLWNLTYPLDKLSADELIYFDSTFEAPCKFARFVTYKDDKLIGSCSYAQYQGAYHPQKFIVEVFVRPDAQGRGIGGALYEHLLEHLRPFDPISLRCQVKEDNPRAILFAEARDFKETKRDWDAVLEVANFDPSPFAGLETKLQTKGIELKTFAELGDTSQNRQAFADMFNEVRLDVPRSEPATPLSFEFIESRIFEAPDFFPEGLFLALTGNELIGLTQFWSSTSSSDLFTGLTGVKQAYRGQGVATALKVKALSYAKEINAPKVYTDNATTNTEMIAVNDKLGFEKQPTKISMVNILKEVERG